MAEWDEVLSFVDGVVEAIASVKGVMTDVSVVVFSDCFGGVAAFVSVFCPPWDFAFWEACEVMGCDDPEAGWGGYGLFSC